MARKEFYLIWTKDSGEEETIAIQHEMIFGRKPTVFSFDLLMGCIDDGPVLRTL